MPRRGMSTARAPAAAGSWCRRGRCTGRTRQRRVKEHQAALAAVKKGDEVITGGGIRGRVTKVSDEEAEVEIANGVRIRVIKSTISQVLTGGAKPAND